MAIFIRSGWKIGFRRNQIESRTAIERGETLWLLLQQLPQLSHLFPQVLHLIAKFVEGTIQFAGRAAGVKQGHRGSVHLHCEIRSRPSS